MNQPLATLRQYFNIEAFYIYVVVEKELNTNCMLASKKLQLINWSAYNQNVSMHIELVYIYFKCIHIYIHRFYKQIFLKHTSKTKVTYTTLSYKNICFYLVYILLFFTLSNPYHFDGFGGNESYSAHKTDKRINLFRFLNFLTFDKCVY